MALQPRPLNDANLQVRSVDSTSLLAGHKTVQIAHNGSVYTLQATKLGKLILTK
ncbi:hemin uptake protein HemP [Comamonas koreensis]|uniref:Hemin uptake protein HemP n=1 Tax=Comamonas koreensis TaxID=160825 RepID=A0AAW4XT35_9BURK|nr:hemin uptake protein HemP [Comamonas koreensis]MCD2164134.1 hemin uptake protein HemP [Comamonas koreensis]